MLPFGGGEGLWLWLSRGAFVTTSLSCHPWGPRHCWGLHMLPSHASPWKFQKHLSNSQVQRTRKGNSLDPLVLRVEHWGESGCIIQNGKEIIRKTSHEVLHMSQNMEKGPNGHTVIVVMAASFEMRLLYPNNLVFILYCHHKEPKKTIYLRLE